MQIVQRMRRLACHAIFFAASSVCLYAEETPPPHIPKTVESNHPVYERTTRAFHADGTELAWMDSLPLEDRIRIRLKQNPSTAPYADKIMITNYEGMVVLEGTVRFYSDRSQIQAVVQQTNGVYRVDNEITTAPIRNRRAAPSQVLPRPNSY